MQPSPYNDLYIATAVKAQENVGALAGVRNRRAENAQRQRDNRNRAAKNRAEGLQIEKAPSGKRGQGGRGIGDTTVRSGGRLERPTRKSGGGMKEWLEGFKGWFNQGDKGGKGLSMPSIQEIGAIAEGTAQVLEGLDKAFGEGDIISMGSGHTYSSGYNPDMYIGQGPGY